ncbi:ECF transporter S component [Candidatus Woesearchaeota archaeon]|nr:ECF transporter S component [Candidatus Woesearchaeota archaeon]
MKIISSVKELTLCSGFGALLTVVQLLAGSIVYAVSQVPASASLFSALILGYLGTMPLLLTRKTGAATITILTAAIVAVPLSVFGPPGPYKILQFIPVVILTEAILIAARWKNYGYVTALAAAAATSIPIHYYFITLIGLPAAGLLAKFLLPIMAVVAAEAAIGAWLAIATYEKKLKKLKVVRQLQE